VVIGLVLINCTVGHINLFNLAVNKIYVGAVNNVKIVAAVIVLIILSGPTHIDIILKYPV